MLEKVNNTQSKHIKELHNKKNRQFFNEFIVEGTKSVLEFMHSDFECIGVFALANWYEENETLPKSIKKYVLSAKQLDQVSTFVNPQPVLALFKIPAIKPFPKQDFVLFLEDIRDPGNLGTIIRSAEWFGLKAVYCSETCADAYNPKVIQASMGSLSRIAVFYLSFTDLKKNFSAYTAVIADMQGTPLKKYTWAKQNILIIGNEANGISKNLKNDIQQCITIPKKGAAESLNASISTAIILSHYFE